MTRFMLALFVTLGLSGAAAAADLQRTILAGGCFWCVESDFDAVPGVKQTVSGYSGGTVDNPTYKQVVKGGTGHLEVVEITYDPAELSFQTLVETFLRSVDVTDDGGQFCDRGHSYTTAIFVTSDEEADIARTAIAEAEALLGQTIVTPVLDAKEFFPAESYHQNFYQKNPLRYSSYRRGCGRDARVQAVWGDQAIKAHGS